LSRSTSYANVLYINTNVSNDLKNHMHLPDQTLSNFAVALTHAARAYRAAAGKITANYGLSQSTVLPVLVISRFG
jgi:hypothetical protein